ncbi:hypothetical protein QUB13_17020 [Microcoleus sp. B4-D4]
MFKRPTSNVSIQVLSKTTIISLVIGILIAPIFELSSPIAIFAQNAVAIKISGTAAGCDRYIGAVDGNLK